MALVNSVKTTKFGVDKNILIAPELAFTMGCLVGNSGVTADSNGRKIIKAGTPVGSTVDVFENRQTVLIVTNTANAQSAAATDGKNSKGILLHDVDVTDGDMNATLVVAGYVDLLKLDVTPVADAKTALSRILFMKGAK